ncbi:MAG: diguanylate cyclase [Terracidiphilus sp.]
MSSLNEKEGTEPGRLLRHPVARYFSAVVLVALVAALRLGPSHSFESTHPWLTFCPVVLLAAVFGGLFAGLLATALSCVVVAILWPLLTSEPYIKTSADWLGMLIFTLIGVMISAVCETMRRSQARVDVYQTLVESLDEGFCVIEMLYDRGGKPVDYRFIECNPAFEQQTGLLQARGKTMRQMVPDHDNHWFEIYGKVARTGEDIRFENSATAMQRHFDVFAFRIGGDRSNKVGILFKDITERKKNEQELITAALYDELTGLPNRAMFRERLAEALARARRGKQSLALLFIDLDGFKAVNDTLGHTVGDDLLRSIAERLVSSVRSGDLVCRFGGDEFALILENCPPEHLPAFAEAFINKLEVPFDLEGRKAQISASIGIVTYPECGTDEETLVQRADSTMYVVKKSGKSGFKVWDLSIPGIGS